MVLLTCEDCGGKVSDLAPACIHCGRPPVAEEVEDGKTLKARAAALASGAAGVAGSAKDSVGGWMHAISEKAAGIKTSIGDRIFEDQEVDVLVLPTGSGPTDFVSYLDLTLALETLAGGRLVRPRLKVWAHREDLDRDQLAKDLEERFSAQVAEFRSARREAMQAKGHSIARRSEEEKTKGRKEVKKGMTTGAAALIGMAVLTNPLLDLFLLLGAVSGGAEAVTGLWRESTAEVEGQKANSVAKAESEAIRKEAESKKKAFRTALDGLEISVHVQLSQLGSDYASVDGVPWMGTDGIEGPSVIEVLQDSQYLGRLPSWYHPLLESRIEEWDSA
jgi:hypothetical protein